MGGGLKRRCLDRVYSADGAVNATIRTVQNRSDIPHGV